MRRYARVCLCVRKKDFTRAIRRRAARALASKHPHVEEELMGAGQPAPTFLLVP